MAGSDNRDVIARFYVALNSHRFDDIAELVHADAVQEWPQSGERIRGITNIRACLENYPDLPKVNVQRVVGDEDKWVLTPQWTPLRITGTGDTYTVEVRIAYPNGEVWNGVSILQFRNAKVSHMTEYFAAPFPAAEWRAKWVERIEPGT